MAQQKKTTFYINPHYGGEWTISKFEDKSLQPPFITGTFTAFAINLGVGLMANFNNKFTIELGIASDNIGTGLSAKFDKSVSWAEIRRLSLRYTRPFKTVRVKRRKSYSFMSELLRLKDEYKYWAIFDIGFIGGFSYEYLAPLQDFSSGNLSIGGIFSNEPQFDISNTEVKNSRGFGAFIGINAQFYQLGKKKFQLGIVYHQGFKKRLITTWQTSINGVEFPPFDLFTRGSAFAMYVSWPIKLFTINQKVKYNE